MTVSNGKSAKQVLDEHAQYYIRRTIEYLKKQGEAPEYVTGHNEQDDKALAALEEIMVAIKPGSTCMDCNEANQYEQNIRQAFSNGGGELLPPDITDIPVPESTGGD